MISKNEDRVLKCGSKLSDIYKRMPYVNIFVGIARELCLNEIEMITFFLGIKKAGFATRGINVGYLKGFNEKFVRQDDRFASKSSLKIFKD